MRQETRDTIVPKKRGRPAGVRNKPPHNMPKTTSITPSSREGIEAVREDLMRRCGAHVTLRATIKYLVESYMIGRFK